MINFEKILKYIFSLFVLAAAFIPTYLFFFFKYLLNPAGFWQTFIFLAVSLYVLGSMQFLFLVISVCVLNFIWTENE
jgi:hypothetical protein